MTNSAGVKVIALDATNINPDSDPVLYESNLTLLTATDGSQILVNNDVKTFILDDYQIDSGGASTPMYLYNLIFTAPSTLFPVKYSSEMLNFDTATYDSIIVSTDDKAQMQLAYQFCQLLMAYSTASLVKSFVSSLVEALSSDSLD